MRSRVVVIGAGEAVERNAAPDEALDAVGLMARAAGRAAEDAGLGAAAFQRLDVLVGVNVLGWRYGSVARALAERLGARPALEVDTAVGGNTPQSMVNRLAAQIRSGALGLALVAGGEAIRSRNLARRAGAKPPWRQEPWAPAERHETWGDDRPGNHPREQAHGMRFPTEIYPLFENALRARLGRTPDEHRRKLGELYTRFSAVAAENPSAWFPTRRSAEEIATATPENRMISYPYTKYLNAVMEVNQGAALLIASEERARALGVAESSWVDFWGGADAAEEAWFVSERPRLDACPAQAHAIAAALAAAGVEAEALGAFDLYSCFPVAVELGAESLGVGAADPRPLTLTGGLAYGGGPGNAYSLHGIAKLVEWLRRNGGAGMATALGWYLTKHAAGVYGIGPAPEPRPSPPAPPAPPVEVADAPRGRCRVEAYTVVHRRDGVPERGIVLGRLEDGRRFLANAPRDAALLESFEREELVGREGTVVSADGIGLFTPD